jgi:hypothetical protein
MFKIPHIAIVRAPGLLPMLYKVSELAQELDIPEFTLRDWLASGAPHERDEKSHIWINGELFAEWVKKQRTRKQAIKLMDGDAYCFGCRAAVSMYGQEEIPIKGKLIHIRGICPVCGTQVQRGGKNSQS